MQYYPDKLVRIGEPFAITYDHDENDDGGTVEIKLATAERKIRVDRVEYINPTGLAAHASNFAVISLKNGAVVVADWSTETGEEGTIEANTPIDLTLSATDTERVVDAGDTLSLSVAESGSTTVPAGRVVVYGRYL